MDRLGDQAHAERFTYPVDCIETWRAVGPQCFVQSFPGNSSRLGYFRHAARTSDVAKRRRKQSAIVRPQDIGQVSRDGYLIIQIRCSVKNWQVVYFKAITHTELSLINPTMLPKLRRVMCHVAVYVWNHQRAAQPLAARVARNEHANPHRCVCATPKTLRPPILRRPIVTVPVV